MGSAIVLAVIDLYLSGHGIASIRRTWIDAPGAGVSLSAADVMLLCCAAIGAVAGWRANTSKRRDP